MNSCWTTIGVRGDGSCPELKKHVHCRNCPTYSAGATQLLERSASVHDLAHWTTHFAKPKPATERDTESVVIFRVGGEWLAFRTTAVTEIANVLPIHSLPHRSNGVLLGVTSVRGELLVCLSLARVLGLDTPSATAGKPGPGVHPRLLVIRRDRVRAVCPVDEVHGIHRFQPRELRDVPATVGRAAATYSTAVLRWRNSTVGVLDDEPLFALLKRSVA